MFNKEASKTTISGDGGFFLWLRKRTVSEIYAYNKRKDRFVLKDDRVGFLRKRDVNNGLMS